MRAIASPLVVAATAAALAAAPPPAPAHDAPHLVRRGECSGRADWRLKLGHEDGGRLEIELEVDQNVTGTRWRVRLFRNGTRFHDSFATTRPPGGELEVRRLIPNRSGPDRITAHARNVRSGEVCRAVATATF